MSSRLLAGQTKVTLQQFEDGTVFQGDVQVAEITQTLTVGEHGPELVAAGGYYMEINMQVLGDLTVGYGDFMSPFRVGNIWRCAHCSSENPKRAKLHSFRPEQEITHCLKCSAPRHIAYG